MTVSIWGNPRTICNLNCSFSMHNWKWENLSKMAGKSSSDKKHNKSSRLVLFIPFSCCFAGSLPFSLSTVKQTKLFHSISEMFFTFLERKTLWVKLFSLNVCEAALQAANKGGNFGPKLWVTPFVESCWTCPFCGSYFRKCKKFTYFYWHTIL